MDALHRWCLLLVSHEDAWFGQTFESYLTLSMRCATIFSLQPEVIH